MQITSTAECEGKLENLPPTMLFSGGNFIKISCPDLCSLPIPSPRLFGPQTELSCSWETTVGCVSSTQHADHLLHVRSGQQGRQSRSGQEVSVARDILLLLVGCLMSQQHASVSQRRICSDSCTCCHTEIAAISLGHSTLTSG